MLRFALPVLLIALPSWAGKGKIIEFKGMPKTIGELAGALGKVKDVNRRAALSLMLDEQLRGKPECTDPKVVDELAYTLIDNVLDRMCEPTEVFSTEKADDRFNPRVDVIFKERVKVRPDRVSANFHRRYQKKPAGKNIDRGYRNQPITFDFAPAADEAEWVKLTDTEAWGLVIHAIHFDPSTGVARVGLSWVSPGTKDKPGSHFERPAWIGFYKRPPAGGTFMPLSVEAVTSSDWREQPINVMPPKAEPNDLSKRLSLAVWMEQIRATPARPAFQGDEEKVFNLAFDGADKLELGQAGWLERYRDSDSPIVRAAAELKIAALGGAWRPDAVEAILRTIKHPAVKAKLEEQLKGTAGAAAAGGDAGAAAAPPDAGKK